MPKTQALPPGAVVGRPWAPSGGFVRSGSWPPRRERRCAPALGRGPAGRRFRAGRREAAAAGGATAPSRGRSEDSRAALREAVQGSAPPAVPGGSRAWPEPAKLSLPGPRQEPADGPAVPASATRVPPGTGCPGMLGAALAIGDQTHLLLRHLTPREKGMLSKRRGARGKGKSDGQTAHQMDGLPAVPRFCIRNSASGLQAGRWYVSS